MDTTGVQSGTVLTDESSSSSSVSARGVFVAGALALVAALFTAFLVGAYLDWTYATVSTDQDPVPCVTYDLGHARDLLILTGLFAAIVAGGVNVIRWGKSIRLLAIMVWHSFVAVLSVTGVTLLNKGLCPRTTRTAAELATYVGIVMWVLMWAGNWAMAAVV